MDMDVAGLFSTAIAAVAVYKLYRIRLADVMSGHRRAISLALAAALLFHAGVLLAAIVSSSRNIESRVEETEMKIQQMEEIIRNYEKQNDGVLSNFASVLSVNPGNIKSMSYNSATSPDGTQNAELTVTMIDADVHEPPAQNGHTEDTMEEAQKVSEEAAPASGTPSPPPQDETMGEQKQKLWRLFSIPADHAFALNCVEDELKVHIKPPSSAGLGEEPIIMGTLPSCCSRLQPFLYKNGKDHTLFLSPPGEQRFVPAPWPRPEMLEKMRASVLWGHESPIADKTDVVPESFTLSPGVAVFYHGPREGRMELLIAANDTVERVELAEEVAARAVIALFSPPSND